MGGEGGRRGGCGLLPGGQGRGVESCNQGGEEGRKEREERRREGGGKRGGGGGSERRGGKGEGGEGGKRRGERGGEGEGGERARRLRQRERVRMVVLLRSAGRRHVPASMSISLQHMPPTSWRREPSKISNRTIDQMRHHRMLARWRPTRRHRVRAHAHVARQACASR